MKRIMAITAAVFVWTGAAVAQQTFEQTVAAAQAAVGDIAKYQEALQNPDPRFQYAMVQQMLKLPDPALQRIAKEHALFSTNPVMREAAIKAILDSETTLRIQLAGTGESYENLGEFVAWMGGQFGAKSGEMLVRVHSAQRDDCWGTSERCFWRQVGSTIQYNAYDRYNNLLASASASLGNDGVLRGTFTHRKSKESRQMQIDLKQ